MYNELYLLIPFSVQCFFLWKLFKHDKYLEERIESLSEKEESNLNDIRNFISGLRGELLHVESRLKESLLKGFDEVSDNFNSSENSLRVSTERVLRSIDEDSKKVCSSIADVESDIKELLDELQNSADKLVHDLETRPNTMVWSR